MVRKQSRSSVVDKAYGTDQTEKCSDGLTLVHTRCVRATTENIATHTY